MGEKANFFHRVKKNINMKFRVFPYFKSALGATVEYIHVFSGVVVTIEFIIEMYF